MDDSVDIIIFSLASESEGLERFYESLSDDEKQRAGRFHFDKHRNRFIAGRGTIRQILATRIDCSPHSIRFELNGFGKPALCALESSEPLHFNASSSDMLGAIAISADHVLGLDIEKIKYSSSEDYDRIVKNEFTEDEHNWYKLHDSSQRPRIFFDFWTCKEAYLKALGIGLSGKLDGFNIDLQGEKPSISHTVLEDCEQSCLSLFRLDFDEQFSACLAVAENEIRIGVSHWSGSARINH